MFHTLLEEGVTEIVLGPGDEFHILGLGGDFFIKVNRLSEVIEPVATVCLVEFGFGGLWSFDKCLVVLCDGIIEFLACVQLVPLPEQIPRRIRTNGPDKEQGQKDYQNDFKFSCVHLSMTPK